MDIYVNKNLKLVYVYIYMYIYIYTVTQWSLCDALIKCTGRAA